MPAGVSSGEATKYMKYMATSPYEGVIYKDMFLRICRMPRVNTVFRVGERGW